MEAPLTSSVDNEIVLNCLDDEFFFAYQPVYDQAELAIAQTDDHDKEFVGSSLCCRASIRLTRTSVITCSRRRSTSALSTMCTSCSVARVISTTELSGMAKTRAPTRKSRALMMASVNGNVRRNVVPTPGALIDRDGSFQAGKRAAHYVHADAASGDFGDALGGGYAGFEHQLQFFLLAHARRLFRTDNGALDCLGDDVVDVQPAAVVGDFDDHVICLVISIQANDALRRFAGRHAFLRCFNSVVCGVTHQMGERLRQSVENPFVEIGLRRRLRSSRCLCRKPWQCRAPGEGIAGKADRPAPCGSSLPSAAAR